MSFIINRTQLLCLTRRKHNQLDENLTSYAAWKTIPFPPFIREGEYGSLYIQSLVYSIPASPNIAVAASETDALAPIFIYHAEYTNRNYNKKGSTNTISR